MATNPEQEQEYFIPAPVLTSSDKLFNFSIVAFSVTEMVEMGAVIGFVYLLWLIFYFLPWQLLLGISVLILFVGFMFVTQPINGLPGDVWIKYALRFYVLERSKHKMVRRGRRFVKVKKLRLLRCSDGLVLLRMDNSKVKGSNE